jgi:predicted GIY-YIG superfamily endonuclease
MTEGERLMRDDPTLVYALQAADANHSYVGATNNFTRRLREHNGEVKGRGALYTRRVKVGNWSPIFKVSGFPARRQALQFEKLFHRGFKRRRLLKVPAKPRNPFGTSSEARRAWHLYHALKKERFSQQETVLTKDLSLKVEWSRKDLYKIATRKLPEWGPATVEHVLVL